MDEEEEEEEEERKVLGWWSVKDGEGKELTCNLGIGPQSSRPSTPPFLGQIRPPLGTIFRNGKDEASNT